MIWWMLGAVGLIAYLAAVNTLITGPHNYPAEAVDGVDIRGHARRTREGYILASRHSIGQIPALINEGIQVVVSAVDPGLLVRNVREYAGIRTIDAPMSNTFRHVEDLLQVTELDPRSVLIHCEHGVDRTGAIAAFLLVARHGWPIPDALYAVVNPARVDVQGLADVLADYGYQDRRDVSDSRVGGYSLSPLGKSGGLKVRSDGYVNLVSTTIDAMHQMGVTP